MARDHAKQTGIALEKAYQFALWLIPTLEKYPRKHKFLLGETDYALCSTAAEPFRVGAVTTSVLEIQGEIGKDRD